MFQPTARPVKDGRAAVVLSDALSCEHLRRHLFLIRLQRGTCLHTQSSVTVRVRVRVFKRAREKYAYVITLGVT